MIDRVFSNYVLNYTSKEEPIQNFWVRTRYENSRIKLRIDLREQDQEWIDLWANTTVPGYIDIITERSQLNYTVNFFLGQRQNNTVILNQTIGAENEVEDEETPETTDDEEDEEDQEDDADDGDYISSYDRVAKLNERFKEILEKFLE